MGPGSIERCRALRAWCIAAMGLLGSTAVGQVEPARFIFDGGFRSTGCLEFGFSRPSATVSADGTVAAPDAPRWGNSESIGGAPVLEYVRKTGGVLTIMGSGVGRDGMTPVLVTYDVGPGFLDVFTVADGDLIEAEATGIGRNRTVLDAANPDMMFGAMPGKRFVPAAASVCHGAVIVFCAVKSPNGGGYWAESAVGFMASTDEGSTWSLLYEDDLIQWGKNRAREWSMQNWWPVTRGPGPTEAFIAAGDYRGNPGSLGGRAYLCRLTRPDADSEWTIEPPTRVYEHEGVLGEHFHTAAVVPTAEGGLRAVVAIGDSQNINRIVGLTRDDHAYAEPGWMVDEAYHGILGSPGTTGNQFVGVAPGPRLGDILVGSDLNDEQVMLLTADGAGSHPKTSWLYGRAWADGRGPANFAIHTAHAELGTGPYVCKYDPHQANADGLVMPRRCLYSPDGMRWVQAAATASGGNWTVGVHGQHVYFSRSGSPKNGLYRTPLPQVVARRPLVIGPGGVQRLVPDPVVTADPGKVTALVKSPEGLWLDEGVPLDPQPPSTGPVYRCRGSVHDAGSRLGIFKAVGNLTDVGSVLGTDAVQIRCWIRNLQDEKSARPRFEFGGGGPLMIQSTTISSTNAWMGLILFGSTPIGIDQTATLIVRSGSVPDDADFYLAIDTIAEGSGVPGFPMPPDATEPPAGTVYADELASVGGFSCEDHWTITLAGMMPQDSWDQSVTTVDEWPLCTMWGDAQNHVALVADTAAGRLRARVVRDGLLVSTLSSSDLFWLRGSSVLVSVYDDGKAIGMTLSAAGLGVEEASVDVPGRPAATPTKVLFGDATGQSGSGAVVRVSPMEWFGGRIDAARMLLPTERQSLLTGLSFLDAIDHRSADLDGDGQFTIFDFLVFQNLFVAGDWAADFDGNGILDLFDYLAFQNAFLTGCG